MTRARSKRRGKGSPIVTSNCEPAEWLTLMSDAQLAQSAVDRLTAGARTLIIEGPSYRQRAHPSAPPVWTPKARPTMLPNTSKWSNAHGNEVVPSRCAQSFSDRRKAPPAGPRPEGGAIRSPVERMSARRCPRPVISPRHAWRRRFPPRRRPCWRSAARPDGSSPSDRAHRSGRPGRCPWPRGPRCSCGRL